MKIAILGAGAWGTALAISQSGKHDVRLWVRDAAQVASMRGQRENSRYLAGFVLSERIHITAVLEEAINAVDLILCAVPVSGLRELFGSLAQAPGQAPIIWGSKGLEVRTGRFVHEIILEIFSDPIRPYGVLSGPSFSEEVARGLPTAITLASPFAQVRFAVAKALHHKQLRVYSSPDVVGVEIGGAVKNVLAIAAGIADGLALGHNARAAMMTRGLAEMARLSSALGGRAGTMMGLAGVGDLILTCTGDLSRNRRVGLMLAQGMQLGNILSALGHVAEGVPTAWEVQKLAHAHHVDMPIVDAVVCVLDGSLTPKAAVQSLLEREPREELS
ncbi:MAG: NAD(P)-dependent glycerol-3-phosphate dehydrogenase [Pseudomonadota bacterium]|nr:NAD(P)-dependent glycerol-3-phosphate dehydrogenase [Pseudomonadota bacterium]